MIAHGEHDLTHIQSGSEMTDSASLPTEVTSDDQGIVPSHHPVDGVNEAILHVHDILKRLPPVRHMSKDVWMSQMQISRKPNVFHVFHSEKVLWFQAYNASTTSCGAFLNSSW
jgi:hypothetical protein